MMPACLNQGSGIGIAAIASLPERRAGNFARAAREAHLLYKGAAQRSAELQDMRRFVTRMGVRRAGMTAVDFSAFVNELAAVSAETILPFFRTTLSIEDKGRPGSFDPVTAADRAAETAMRTLIRRNFPDHGIIGEEYGEERADAEYVWVLDPIDGTKSFISGMPAWGTLIALLRAGEPVFGLMNQPFTRECFSGDGGRAHYRGPAGERELRVRPCPDLAGAVLFTTSPLLMDIGDRAVFGRVEQRVRLSRYGGDCYAYCMLAAGHVDLVIETELKPYDVLPLIPIIVGAGGIISSWEGGAPHKGGRIIAAGDKRIHAAAVEVLSKQAAETPV